MLELRSLTLSWADRSWSVRAGRLRMEGHMPSRAVAAVAGLLTAVPGPKPAADLEYLQHSGWLIKTPGHVLVFDYVESLSPTNPLPPELRLSTDSFDQRPARRQGHAAA